MTDGPDPIERQAARQLLVAETRLRRAWNEVVNATRVRNEARRRLRARRLELRSEARD